VHTDNITIIIIIVIIISTIIIIIVTHIGILSISQDPKVYQNPPCINITAFWDVPLRSMTVGTTVSNEPAASIKGQFTQLYLRPNLKTCYSVE